MFPSAMHPRHIDYDRFPEQGRWLGRRAAVGFHWGDERVEGEIVRDDTQDPFVQIIKLDDGRLVLKSECTDVEILPTMASGVNDESRGAA